jgi:hypothetical protein
MDSNGCHLKSAMHSEPGARNRFEIERVLRDSVALGYPIRNLKCPTLNSVFRNESYVSSVDTCMHTRSSIAICREVVAAGGL